jgi:ferritin-like metal-binding protein YciE
MAVQDPKDVFVMLLNDLRQNEERTASTLQEISDAIEDPDIRETIESRIFLKNQTLSTLDRCFQLIGERPTKPGSQVHDAFVEEFRNELDEIKGPVARTLFLASVANRLMHFRVAEYGILTAMADITGHYAVGSLLQSCLADKLTFVERLRRRVRRMVESEIAVGVA